MPITESDPRVFFAAERTLLAWLRTGLTIMAGGFVVARFGLFLRFLAPQLPLRLSGGASLLSAGLGILLVVLGSVGVAAAAAQHRRFVATLSGPDLPPAYPRESAVVLSFAVAALGMVLAVYLAVTTY